jgi:hypothetical protein
MGWKSFSKLFNPTREVSIADMSGMTIAVDAMTEIYRGALATKNVGTLTDKNGTPTIHISVVISSIMEFLNNDVKQIWIFDHSRINTAKIPELAKRKEKKDKAIKELKELSSDDEIQPEFIESVESVDEPSDSDIEIQVEKMRTITELKIKKRDTLQKQAFTVSKQMISDIKFILDSLNIEYMEAPEGFEAEGLASYLNKIDIVDAVFSGDTDAITYGAKTLFRRVPVKKAIYEYTFDNIIEQVKEQNDDLENYNIDLLIKCALIMGTDFCAKTPRIGPGTVLKKIDYIELTVDQQKAFHEFKKIPDMNLVVKSNPPTANNKLKYLIQWLVEERQFNEERITKKLTKINKPIKKKSIVKTDKKSTEKPVEKQVVKPSIRRRKTSRKTD